MKIVILKTWQSFVSANMWQRANRIEYDSLAQAVKDMNSLQLECPDRTFRLIHIKNTTDAPVDNNQLIDELARIMSGN
jgi:hypothetical protein